MTWTETLHRYLENWQDEVDSAAQYRALATSTKEAKLARIYENLARVEEAHASFWEERLRREGVPVPPRKPSWRSRILIFVARHLGPQFVVPTIAAQEHVDRNSYAGQPESRHTRMPYQERWHARLLQVLLKTQPEGVEGGMLSKLEGRHRAVGGNALRAAVLGANDGLCSNLSLVMGVAGAAVAADTILVTGLAGLMAGAFSMALGEWISVTSARELAERELRIEADELNEDPEGEAQELRLIYEAKGLSPAQAETTARQLIGDKAAALDTLSREELGIDPRDLGGSAWEAALVSFALFAVGAVIPVLPFFFWRDQGAVLASAGLSALALFLIGGLITIFTGRPFLTSGARQLLLGLTAAAITFAIGRWIGVSIA